MKQTHCSRTIRTFFLLCFLGLAAIVSAQDVVNPKDTLFLEAEGFANKGGWVVDQQYMDVMGSPVILAHGYGEPVGDAVTNITFPKPGQYRVFVRTRNWVAPWAPEETPGKFQLVLDGKPLETEFGTENVAWHWQSGGTVTVAPDRLKVDLAIRDLTGFDGRCDAIILTADPAFTPPEDAKALTKMRRTALGLTPDPLDAPPIAEGPFDLVVGGGGMAGMCAAITAARLGCKVALIQDRPVLGGNNSSEVRVHLMGRTNYPPYPNLGNLVHQLDPLQTGNAQRGEVYKDEKKLALVKAEKNLTLYLSTHVIAADVDTSGGKKKIKALIAKNIETNAEHRFEGKWFADCTGDGSVGFLAGAEWRMGRESKEQTGESLAPEKPDHLVMGASTQWYSVPAKDAPGDPNKTDFPALPWAVQFNEQSAKPALDGEWDWETGLNKNQIMDFEQVRDHALRAVYGHWSYVKNFSAPEWRQKAAGRKLGWVAFIAGKRESRRIMGDVILQEQDIVEAREFDDACVVTTWTIDLHYPTDHQKKHFPGEEFRTVAHHKQITPYAIPYRCFYSKDVDNLFMAGRCISVTHVALGTIRVQRTGGMMGEVVGMAASLCRKHDGNPRDVYQKYLPELKELMTAGIAPHPEKYYPSATPIMPLPKAVNKPAEWLKTAGKNLARDAKVTASSSYKKASYPVSNINDGRFDVKNNGLRWVSDELAGPHEVQLDFSAPVKAGAVRIVSGQANNGTGASPITDFVLQYRKADGSWSDIAETKTKGNTNVDCGIKFPQVESSAFRLLITATPGDLARIWELELYE